MIINVNDAECVLPLESTMAGSLRLSPFLHIQLGLYGSFFSIPIDLIRGARGVPVTDD